MNFLQLCQRVVQEGGISRTGSAGPSTVVGQVGEMGRVVGWVDDAYMIVQRKHKDWGWLRQTATFPTVAGATSYPIGTGAGTVGVAVSSFRGWVLDSARNYVTSVGLNSEVFMDYTPYEDWRDKYLIGALRTVQTRPIEFSVAPNRAITVGPLADASYTILIDYYTSPQHLTLDADVTALPDEMQMIIVWRALMEYAMYESAPEVYARAERNYNALMRDLELDWLPDINFAGALA